MIIWGSKTIPVDVKDLGVSCKVCDGGSVALAAFQKVFTLYWIPTFPLKKSMEVVCPSCNTTYPLEVYSEYLNPRETKFKTPWRSYLGLMILSGLIFSIFISAFNNEKRIIEFKNNPTAGSYFIFKNIEEEHKTEQYAFAKVENVTHGKIIVHYSEYSYSKESEALKDAKSSKSQNENLLNPNISRLSKMDVSLMDIKTILK